MLAENVDDARLKRKLSLFARKNFAGDKKKAASFLLTQAIELSDVIDWKRLEQLSRLQAHGMLKKRVDTEATSDVANKGQQTRAKKPRRANLRKLKAFGLWADRDDMKDSIAWLEARRENERERRRKRYETD